MPDRHRTGFLAVAGMMSRDDNREVHGLLTLARLAAALKSAPRTGWLDRGIDPGLVESVADHSLGVAFLAWACALERQRQGAVLEPSRVVLLALVHDLLEAKTGDTPPYDPAAVPGADDSAARSAFLNRRHIRADAHELAKRAGEDGAMLDVLEALPETVRTELGHLWEELRLGTSAEARFVKQVDRLETFLQSRSYLADAPDLPMDSFRREVMETIDDPLLAAIRDAALANESS